MSLLCVGLSHRTAPVDLLERVVPSDDGAARLLAALSGEAAVLEALVLGTCNRVEIYAEVERFHAGLAAVSGRLASFTGTALDELTPHLYVHYDDRAVNHLFSVAAGLDSLVVGEAQILGQLRAALQTARATGIVGRSLGSVVPQALRVGKRVHSDTGIDRAGQSLVTLGAAVAADALGGLTGRRVLVLGAGSLGGLVVATLRRLGVGPLTVLNRTPPAARRLAREAGADSGGLDRLPAELAHADLVVSCTGATGVVVTADQVRAAAAGRSDRPLFLLDLALPRDVEPDVRKVPGVTVADLETLRGAYDSASLGAEIDAARAIVTAEVTAYQASRRAARVAPTVAALRSRADAVVDAELDRLTRRLPGLADRDRREVAVAVRRVVDKLLHTPTVRVKELAEEPGGDSYEHALRELFGLGAPTDSDIDLSPPASPLDGPLDGPLGGPLGGPLDGPLGMPVVGAGPGGGGRP
jgi:glutamyl-tRNA reductase